MPRRRASEDEWEEDRNAGGPQRNAANARERARMRVLSRAFCRLKTTLPWVPADTKLSKLDTLRLATSYIAHLRTLLCLDHEDDEQIEPSANVSNVHPLNLTWPFTFAQTQTSSAVTNGSGTSSHDTTTPWTDNRTSLCSSSSPASSTNSTSSGLGRLDECSNNKNVTVPLTPIHLNNYDRSATCGDHRHQNCDPQPQFTNSLPHHRLLTHSYYNPNNNYTDSLLQIG